ncbi:MAG: flagellin [Planctomycetaceae bacterium]|jgi:flagellin|nr:flagellin [Planctomycetaceae bacterium]
MSLTINTNPAAIKASFNLSKNHKSLQKSLTRLSSGKRITKPSDDAGGLAVSMKLAASINRTSASIANIQNARSFAEVQDGSLEAGARIIDRMAELKSLSLDVLKSDSDKANYNTEFQALQQQLYQIGSEKFNGVSLFATTNEVHAAAKFGDDAGAHTISVYTSSEGAAGSRVSLNKALLMSAVTFLSATSTDANVFADNNGNTTKSLAAKDAANALGIQELGISFFTAALENIATLRAQNGATTVRMNFAEDHLRLSKANLQSANSRIMDVDVAAESTNLARYNILAQASTSMLAQANIAPNSALMLLG